ncbi:MAG TPA: septum formation initiator family protein [Dissulfurispiraceae bacterium]|nr:septum formation initiator family protein [Dissulfurispiraceae bacterium]
MARVARYSPKARSLRQQVAHEQKRRSYIFFAVIAIALAYLSYNLVFSDMGLVKYLELKKNKSKLETEITRVGKENKAISEQVNALKKDPYFIEKYAREEYGMAKRDEFIFQYKNSDK